MLIDGRAAAAAAVFCTGVLLTCIETQAQAIPKEVAARVEMHTIPSLTLPDRQFLAGDVNGSQPVTVAGELKIAQEAWTRHLNSMGISTFVIDGFSGRGLTSVNQDQAKLGRLNFILDIYGALEILARHPRVDPERIVLMGFSRGGQGALYAGLKRFHETWNRSGAQFAGYIAFYPDCATTYAGETDVVDRPIRIFHGTPDDYNPVTTCKAYVARLQEEQRDVTLTEYPDSQHGFDAGLLGVSSNVVAAGAQTVRNCRIKEGDGGVLINAETNEPFSYKDACVEIGPHVGGNPVTAEEARKAVSEFLQALFRLG